MSVPVQLVAFPWSFPSCGFHAIHKGVWAQTFFHQKTTCVWSWEDVGHRVCLVRSDAWSLSRKTCLRHSRACVSTCEYMSTYACRATMEVWVLHFSAFIGFAGWNRHGGAWFAPCMNERASAAALKNEKTASLVQLLETILWAWSVEQYSGATSIFRQLIAFQTAHQTGSSSRQLSCAIQAIRSNTKWIRTNPFVYTFFGLRPNSHE